MLAAIISANGDIPITFRYIPTAHQDLESVLGGSCVKLHLPEYEATLCLSGKDGTESASGINHRATHLVESIGRKDPVRGDVVLTGTPGANGEVTDLSEESTWSLMRTFGAAV